MEENQTKCHTCFSITSNGEIQDKMGLVANSNGDFDPAYITEKLGIEPYKTMKKGTPRKSNGFYGFSDWIACYQDTPILDVEEQCMKIIRILNSKIPQLLEIRNEFDVSFSIVIVPHIYNEETPAFVFNKEIIEFCYITGTEIGIDMYVYDKE